MRIGQPISWKEGDGNEYIGIVADVLPTRKGVLAYLPNSKSKIKVSDPHKIRDPKLQQQVLKHFAGYPEAVEFLQDGMVKESAVPAQAPVKQPKYTPPQSDLYYLTVNQQASQELETLSLADRIRLNGMGFDIKGLPDADKTTTPIDKQYF